jgi:hypothetical protein
MGDIILGGGKYECRAPVLTWHDHGLEFKAGKGSRRRHPKQSIELLVYHWTGGENPPPTMFRVLEKRALGIEFAIAANDGIDGYATLWQFCDPLLVDTFDAGYVNRRSIGVEIVNYGYRRLLRRVPRAGRSRDVYFTEWNGRTRKFARFHPAQLNTAHALAETIINSEVTGVLRRLPRDGDSRVGDVLRRTMKRSEVDAYAGGVIGHNHLSSGKSDPGTDLFTMFEANGY